MLAAAVVALLVGGCRPPRFASLPLLASLRERVGDNARRRRACRCVVALLALLFVPTEVHAFCRSTTCRPTKTAPCTPDENECPPGTPLYWTSSCIGFSVNQEGTSQLPFADAKRVIQKAFHAWSDLPCPGGGVASITFSPLDDVPCKQSEYNATRANVNVVLFQDNDWNYNGIDGTLAKTSVTFNSDNGEIYDADIEVNAAENGLTITDDPTKIHYDLLAVTTHEVGHFIGLAHSALRTASMYKSYDPGSFGQRNVGDDDTQGICLAYPPGRSATCDPIPRNGFGGTCDGPGGGGLCAVAARRDETHPGESEGAALGFLRFLPLGAAVAVTFRRTRRPTGAKRRENRDPAKKRLDS